MNFFKQTITLPTKACPLAVLILVLGACTPRGEGGKVADEAKPAGAPAPREMPKTLPLPDPEVVERQQKATDLLEELHRQLQDQKDMQQFALLVGRLKGKQLMANAHRQGYRVFALTDAAMQQLPPRERAMLTSDRPEDLGYQMKFFIHHACPQPDQPYPGFAFRTLSGMDLRFSKDSVEMPHTRHKVRVGDERTEAGKLHVFPVSGPLFY
ncbi:MAG: hypothetical protein KBF37_11600 [Saprospiraceae bacterium]|jgi:hypothetical protein|nr:hypothetical protein [Saprospiraceae bacterium]MBP9210952.1 hypothetical protein [Saprospiraceae bacterium]